MGINQGSPKSVLTELPNNIKPSNALSTSLIYNSDYNELINKPQINGVTLIGNKLSPELFLLGVYEEQTVLNKTINAEENIILNLTLDNMSEESISYYNNVDFDNIENAKFATDVSVSSSIPVMSESATAINIVDSDFLTNFYNLGFSIRDGKASESFTNTVKYRLINNIGFYGVTGFSVQDYIYTNKNKVDKFYEFGRFIGDYDDQSNLSSANGFDNNILCPLKQYSIIETTYTNFAGISYNEYVNPDSLTQRNYILLTSPKGPQWLIPLTVYGVTMTFYKDGEIVTIVPDTVTLEEGFQGDTCTANYFYPHWFEGDELYPVESFCYQDYDNVEIIYNGNNYEGWRMMLTDPNLDLFYLDKIDDRNSDADYIEIRQPYNLTEKYQQVENSNGDIGFIISPDFSLLSNMISNYFNQPNDLVDESTIIYKSLIPSEEPQTLFNDGTFRYTFRMFMAPSPDDTYKIAYTAYQLQSKAKGDYYIQWTIDEGVQGSSYSGQTSNEPNEVQWSYNDNSIEWYSVKDKNDDSIWYLPADELPSGTQIGDDIASGLIVHFDRFFDSPERETQENEFQLISLNTETCLEYTGEISFIYNGEVDDDAQRYFSEDNFGLFKNNHDGTYTKIEDAYQWKCCSASSTPNINIKDYSPITSIVALPNGIVIPQIDYSLNGLYWWVMRAWECVDENNNLGWTPIPPEGSNPTDEDFSEYEGQEISSSYYKPMSFDGTEIQTSSLSWSYTGNYSSDFLGRWTDFQTNNSSST